MKDSFKIPLSTIVDDFHFEILNKPENYSTIQIYSPEVNRPALALAGFTNLFDSERIQLIGKAEYAYLDTLDEKSRELALRKLVSLKPVAIIFTTNLPVDDFVVEQAKIDGVTILRTDIKTSPIMASLISSLNVYLAPRITRHGGLVEVYGEGLLLLGDSGIGKSETAIELVKRGHRLIADDAVEIKKVSNKTLVGSAPALIKHYVELRGIGIVDVRRLFGMGAIKETQQIDLVIQLENWVEGKMYDRLGLEDEYITILGNQIPTITIPVRPGRNLSIVLEVAAMNNRQKKLGYNTAEEFNRRLMKQFEENEQ